MIESIQLSPFTPPRSIGSASLRRLLPLIAVVGILTCIWSAVAVTPAGAAETTEFCRGAWLNKYGQPGDSCAAGHWGYQFWVQVNAHEHSACANITVNSQKSGAVGVWSCTSGPWSQVVIYPQAYTWSQPIMRNNTTGDTNHADGYQYYCETYHCEGGS